MFFDWVDYIPEDAALIDGWLDNTAVAMTGIDGGWGKYWSDVTADSVNYPGCRDYCKVVKEDGVPIAAVVFGAYCGSAVVSEIVVDPALRTMGYGARIIRELVNHADVWFDERIAHFRAVIFRSNVSSQKAFQNAGFVPGADQDGTAVEYVCHMLRDNDQ